MESLSLRVVNLLILSGLMPGALFLGAKIGLCHPTLKVATLLDTVTWHPVATN